MKLIRLFGLVVVSGLALMLASCGGGGAGGSSSPSVTGRVLDGYINGATVFWDCNGNHKVDASEVQVRSGASGAYSISGAPSSNCVLVAEVPLGAIDEDTPLSPVDRSYTLISTKGNENLITPLSTLVAAHMAQNPTASITDAQTAVSSLLGITGNINSDYIAVKTGDHEVRRGVAKIIAIALQNNNLKNDVLNGISSGYSDVQSMASSIKSVNFSSSTAIDNFNNSFRGFLKLSTYSQFSKNDTYNTRPNSQLNLTETQLQLLDSIITNANLNDYIRNGVINFQEIPYADLVAITQSLRGASLIADDTNIAVKSIRQKRNEQQQNEAVFYTANLQNKNNFFSRDIATNFEFLTTAAIATAESVSGVISFTTGAPNIDLRKFKSKPKLKKIIRVTRDYKLGEITMALLQGLNTAGKTLSAENQVIINNLINSDGQNLTKEDYDALLELTASLVNLAKDSFKTSNIKIFVKIFEPAVALYNGANLDCSNPINFECIYNGLEVMESIGEWVHFPMAIKGEIQWFRSTMDVWDASTKYGAAVGKESSIQQDVVLKDWKARTESIRLSYLLQELTAAGLDQLFEAYDPSIPCANNQVRSHGTCRASAPIVISITPQSATVGQSTTFAIAGTNLPTANGLDVTFNGCANIAFSLTTVTLHKFTCTPQAVGTIAVVARAVFGGSVLKSQDVVVSSGTTLLATNFVRGSHVGVNVEGYGPNLLLNSPPTEVAANSAEWDFAVSKSGTYEIFTSYAASVSRPVTISVNGNTVFSNAMASITGGWFEQNVQEYSEGRVTLSAGANTLRVSRSNVFPHIRNIRLVYVN